MKKYLLTFMAVISILGLVAPSMVLADTAKDSVCEGVGLTSSAADGSGSGTSGCNDTGGTTVTSIIAVVINVLGFIVGVAAVIMIIISGLRFVTSNGDPQKVSSARDGILYSVVGLVVALLSQIIVKFVLHKV